MQQPPFINGPPRFDVGLRPIALADWLFPDDQAHWLDQKNALINTRRDEVFAASSTSRPAQTEVAALISQAGRVCVGSDTDPLIGAARLVSDDLVIIAQVEGQWKNTACCLCNPTFFSAQDAYGKSLALLHEPVPDGDFGLAARIGRVFTNLAPDTILERHNWTVQWSDARYTPDGTPLRAAAAQADTAQASDNLFLRVERQTIRKLPQTGAVLFTIRIRLTKLTDLLVYNDYNTAFAQAWKTAPQNVRDYKKWAVLERHVAAVLAV
jgi:dimethylamine monooxygenase subunit A